MNPISAFFVRNIIPVFFFYGLAFFVMGMALALASRQTSKFRFVQAIRPLALFGILHGSHEWFEMFQKMATLTAGHLPTILEEIVRLIILGSSFSMLLLFGITLLSHSQGGRWQKYSPIGGMLGVGAVGLLIVVIRFRPPAGEIVAMADVLMRYSLGIPAAVLGTWALMRQQRTFRERNMPQFGRDLVWCAAALFLYGVVGQLFVRPTILAPTTVFNSTLFLQWFGIPIQLFRAIMAVILTFYMIRALRAFELENRQRLEMANRARLLAQAAALEAERRLNLEAQRRGKLLGELLHQVVTAQESERQRIARELHDATGQSLTAITLGLRGIEGLLADASPLVLEQIRELKSFGTNALGELRRLIADLRPPQLDDLGLIEALQWYVQAFEKRYKVCADFVVRGEPVRLPAEYETVLFRLAQEALTNVAKHARAHRATVRLEMDPAQIQLCVTDDGQGFNPRTVFSAEGQPVGWGLLGIRERTLLLGGQYEIDSSPGCGTRIVVTIPVPEAIEDVENTTVVG